MFAQQLSEKLAVTEERCGPSRRAARGEGRSWGESIRISGEWKETRERHLDQNGEGWEKSSAAGEHLGTE